MDDRKIIAFVAYPEMTPLDLIGPLQVIKLLEGFGPYQVVTVAESLEPVTTDVGLKVQAERSFEEVPRPFALVLPGGAIGPIKAIVSDTLMAYVREAADGAEIVGSVCTGSIILAAAGLLEGRRATTHWAFLDYLARLGVQPTRKRWVEDGKFITAAGVSAGIDMALALTARLAGEVAAKTIQAIIEYDPEPPFGAIEWAEVERMGLGPSMMSSLLPIIRGIIAAKPELAAKLFPGDGRPGDAAI